MMDLGQVAYEAYLTSCDGKSIRGEKLPGWDGQAPGIREHWRASADAVRMFTDMRAEQDACLIAIEDGKPLPFAQLLALPPWRAVLLARIAAKAGVPLERGTADQLHAEAQEVGGAGRLGPWWERA